YLLFIDFVVFFFFQAEDGIRDGHVTGVQTCALPIYTVFLEPIATDAIFVAGRALSLQGNFSGGTTNSFAAMQRNYLFADGTDTLTNPFHNFTSLRYAGISRLPTRDAAKLGASGTDYSRDITSTYLQLPPELDPRIPELAREITKNANTPFDKTVRVEAYLR